MNEKTKKLHNELELRLAQALETIDKKRSFSDLKEKWHKQEIDSSKILIKEAKKKNKKENYMILGMTSVFIIIFFTMKNIFWWYGIFELVFDGVYSVFFVLFINLLLKQSTKSYGNKMDNIHLEYELRLHEIYLEYLDSEKKF